MVHSNMHTQPSTCLKSKFEYHPDGYLMLRNPYRKSQKGKRIGYINSSGYHCVQVDRKMVRVHRIVFFLHHGYMPEIVDHIDGDKNNNKIENLREVTQKQNTWNRNVKGYCKHGRRWRVQVVKDGVPYRAYVDTESEAQEFHELLKEELHEGYHRC